MNSIKSIVLGAGLLLSCGDDNQTQNESFCFADKYGEEHIVEVTKDTKVDIMNILNKDSSKVVMMINGIEGVDHINGYDNSGDTLYIGGFHGRHDAMLNDHHKAEYMRVIDCD